MKFIFEITKFVSSVHRFLQGITNVGRPMKLFKLFKISNNFNLDTGGGGVTNCSFTELVPIVCYFIDITLGEVKRNYSVLVRVHHF